MECSTTDNQKQDIRNNIMKSYYKTTRTIEHPSFPEGYKQECFTPRFVEDLYNMDIISDYTKHLEPRDDDHKKSPHILIEISTDQYNKLKSIENDVNEKYFEMGGDNVNGWNNVSQMVLDIFEKGYREEVQYGDYREKQYEEKEEATNEERL